MSNAIGVLFDGRSKLLRLVELGKCEGKMIESDLPNQVHFDAPLEARWVRAGSGHRPAPDSTSRDPEGVPAARWRRRKNLKGRKKFQGLGENFFAQGIIVPVLPAYSRALPSASHS